jgi:thiol-disulfide isomerase/thioredoxin
VISGGASLAANLRLAAAPLAFALMVAGCAHAPHGGQGQPEMTHPEGAIFDPSIDAHAAVDAALANAAATDKLVLLVMGANWCHDSRALTSYLMAPELAALLEESFEVVYIDVGLPQTGDGFNLDIAEHFGVTSEGTPNVLVIDSDGALLNSQDDVTSWRNSASRTPAEVLATLQGWATAN